VSEQIRRGALDFYEAAQSRLLAEADRPAAASRPLFEVLQRGQASLELADAVFAAAPGDVVGPVRTGGDSTLVLVLSLTPARLDEPTRRAIQEILFA